MSFRKLDFFTFFFFLLTGYFLNNDLMHRHLTFQVLGVLLVFLAISRNFIGT